MKFFSFFLLGLVLAMPLLGCASRPVMVAATASIPAPVGPAPEQNTLLAKLAAQEKAIRSVESGSMLEVFYQGRHERLDLNFIVEKPTKATFELTGPTGMLAALTSDGREFRYYDIRNGHYVFGPLGPKSLSVILPWTVRAEELIPLLCATPLGVEGPSGAPIWDTKEGRWKIERKSAKGGWAQTLWFDEEGHLMRAEVWGPELKPRYTVTYLNWRKVGSEGLEFPVFIKLHHVESDAKLNLRLRGEPVLNAAHDPEFFRLPFKEGIPKDYVPAE